MNDNKDGIIGRFMKGFYKSNMTFTLPDRHEKIFTLLARDHYETPSYFKNTNLFDSRAPSFNIGGMFNKTRDSSSDYHSLIQDFCSMGDSMITMDS